MRKVRPRIAGVAVVKLAVGEGEWLELAMRCGFCVKAMAAVLRVS